MPAKRDERLDGWATRRQVAEFTGFSEKTLAQFAVRRIGPPFRKFGSGRSAAVRYSWADVRAWVEKQPLIGNCDQSTPRAGFVGEFPVEGGR